MAENILGLLFVTSSSRGRHVFRYPPDPKSPHTWLTQPIYSSDTYTATDTAVQRPKRKVFFDETDAKSSTASLRRMGRPWGDGSSVGTPAGGGGIAMSSGMPGRLLDYGSDTFGEEDGSDSDLSEDDYLDQARTNQSSSKDGGTTKETTAPSSPRVSLSVNKAETTAPAQDRGPDRFIESQYNSALNYSLDFLSDMLTPPRSAGNRKFEICVDELVFVGHPVFNNPDGKWGYPADPEEDVDTRVTGRGRRMREGGNPLAPVEEGKESTSPENHEPVPDTQQKKSDSVDRPPMLNMFHLVLILDKPDPKPWAQVNDGPPPLTPFDEVYREIAFKWTAAAFALQVQDGYIAREAWGMAKTREKAINDSIPIRECSHMVYEKYSLDRALNQLFIAIQQFRTKPSNPLYSHLPNSITVNLADIPISMVLSPQSVETDEAWAHWGERDDLSSSDDEVSEMGWDASMKQLDLRVEPWQTLLLIDEDATEKAGEISTSMVGLGIGRRILDESEKTSPMPMSRGASRERSMEEDEGLLMRSLIGACDVSKPLVDIAHILRCDLDGIVIPLARDLVQNKRAILIDVINTRLRTVVMPTTIDEHTTSIDMYADRFVRAFPSLPSLASFIGMISASPRHVRNLLPSDIASDSPARQLYMDALIWLLKQDLVVQVHTRARVFARPEIKEAAWRKLWHRRRDRWLRSQAYEKSPDLRTPRALNGNGNPMDATVPPPKMDQSFMDFDPDLEMDSDMGEGDTGHLHDMDFSMNVVEPENVPEFGASFIFKPARAQKDEARWLRVIRESADAVWASKFDLCVQYFDGVATFEEISFRTGLQRRELDRILQLFKDDVSSFAVRGSH